MRRGLSKTFRSNLVEFDTDLGLRYAVPPTVWVRIYLIWTFRNFRSLPKQVFNRHQQKLIDELIRSSTIAPGKRVDRSSVIGTVEQVRIKSRQVAAGAAVPEAPAKIEVAHNRPQVIVRASTSEQEPVNQANPQLILPPKSLSTISTWRERKFRVNKRAAALLSLGSAVLFTVLLLWHGIHIRVRADHVRTSSTMLPTPLSKQPQIQTVALPVPAAPPTQQLSHSTDKTSGLVARQLTASSNLTAGSQSLAPGSLSSSNHKEGQLSLAAMLTPTETRTTQPTKSLQPETSDLDSLPRLAGPPQFRMIYPTYPETQQDGKVLLTAVVAPDGTVKSVTVISGKKIFASAALKAVRQWRYLPYELQGRPVEFQTAIAFDFRGDEVISVSFPQL